MTHCVKKCNFNRVLRQNYPLSTVFILVLFLSFSQTTALFEGYVGRNNNLASTKFCQADEANEDADLFCSSCTPGTPNWNDGTQCLFDDILKPLGLPQKGHYIDIYLDNDGVRQYRELPCGTGEFCAGYTANQMWKLRCQRGLYSTGDPPECKVCHGIHTGFYGDNGNCYSCAPGFVPDFDTDADCKPAPPGYHSDGFGLIPLASGLWSKPANDGLSYSLAQADSCPGFVGITTGCLVCSDTPGSIEVPNPYTGECELCPAGHSCSKRRWDDITPCPAGEWSAEGAKACETCENGFFGPKRGSCLTCQNGEYYDSRTAECVTCPAGFFCTPVTPANPAITPAVKIPCPRGTYSADGATQCDPCNGLVTAQRSECRSRDEDRDALCPDGYWFNPGAETANNCEICPGGYRCPNDFTIEPCPRGSVAKEGKTACTVCGEGEHPNNERTECKLCTDGTYWDNEKGICEICPINHRCNKNVQAPCPQFFSAIRGSSECSKCDYLILGFDVHRDSVDGPVIPGGTCCSDDPNTPSGCGCKRGFYFQITKDEDSQKYVGKCTGCPKGAACFRSMLVDCPRGLYQDNVELDTCSKCDGGFPVDSIPENPIVHRYLSCKDCEPGRYIDEISLTCQTCPAGHRCVNGIKEVCPPHYYQPIPGKSVCDHCPGTVSIDRTKCDECEAGFYFDSNSRCMECNLGHFCEKGLQIKCPKGYYANIRGLASCMECPGQVNSDSSNCITGVSSSLMTYQRGIDGENPLMVWLTWLVIFIISIGVYFLLRIGCFHLAIKAGLEKPKEVKIK